MNRKSLSLFFIIVFVSHSVWAVEIKTTIDRNPVQLNESFKIIFSASDTPDGSPDFSTLKQDFEILNSSQQTSSSWINGKATKSTQWILNVMAKKAGDLTIPAISFGKHRSSPQVVHVEKSQSTQQSHQNDELFLDINVSTKTPYVQAQVLYTLRFYRRVQIAQASLNDPEIDHAIIEKLGNDNNFKTEINGVSYAVTERRYAIFPQKSGKLTIEPLSLIADVVTKSRPRFNGFFNSPNTKTTRVSSDPITLNVQPVPDSFKGKHWLPAEQLHLEEKWSNDNQETVTGEPITRTISLLAKGVSAAQLPVIEAELQHAKLKNYPDQPVLKEQKNPDGILSLREQKNALIPSSQGEYQIPEIKILWFNTRTNQPETAVIPATSIIASAATGTNAPSSPQNQPSTPSSQPENHATVTEIVTVENTAWKWATLLLSLCLMGCLFYLYKIQQTLAATKEQDNEETIETIQLKDTVKALKNACRENDNIAAKNALLNWGRLKFDVTNLNDIANRSEARLRDEINLLNRSLYAGGDTTHWEGKKLFQSFSENNARERVGSKNDPLEPLFKINS